MDIIEIKTVDPFFDLVWNGIKDFEVRKNDRDYKTGRIVLLRQYDPNSSLPYSGRSILIKIKYVLHHEEYQSGIQPGYCVFGFDLLSKQVEEKFPDGSSIGVVVDSSTGCHPECNGKRCERCIDEKRQ